MTLTQRLTRAGATFIVFGVVAAILPQQNGSAQAVTDPGTCNNTTAYYKLTEGGSSTDSTSSTVTSIQNATVNAFASSDNSNFHSVSASYSYTGDGANLSTTIGSSTTVSRGSIVSGSYTLTGTFTDPAPTAATHIVNYPIIVN